MNWVFTVCPFLFSLVLYGTVSDHHLSLSLSLSQVTQLFQTAFLSIPGTSWMNWVFTVCPLLFSFVLYSFTSVYPRLHIDLVGEKRERERDEREALGILIEDHDITERLLISAAWEREREKERRNASVIQHRKGVCTRFLPLLAVEGERERGIARDYTRPCFRTWFYY